MAPKKMLRVLISSHWLRVGAFMIGIFATYEWVLYAVTARWHGLRFEI